MLRLHTILVALLLFEVPAAPQPQRPAGRSPNRTWFTWSFAIQTGGAKRDLFECGLGVLQLR
jgi:hypothetical protein